MDTLIHEVGAAQMEINFIHGDRWTWPTRSSCSSARARGRAAARHLRDLHGQADGARAGQRDARAPEPGRRGDGAQPVRRRRGGLTPSSSFSYIGGLQNYLPAAMPLLAPNVNSYRRLRRYSDCADQPALGLRQPHGRAARARVRRRGAPGREPLRRRRCQPLSRDRGDAGLRLLGMNEELEPTEPIEGSAYGPQRPCRAT